MVSNVTFTPVLPFLIGMIFILFGIVAFSVSYLSARGRIKPNGVAGVRLNYTRNYKLYQQDKYWYDINRYGGKKGIFWSLLLVSAGILVILLPVSIEIKMLVALASILFVMAGFVVTGWQVYHFAEGLVKP